MQLDRIDFEILDLLQKDAEISNKELAEQVELAASSCFERVRKLREGGVLRGSHASVDPVALGIGLQALIAVRLRQHSRGLVDAFREHARALCESIAVYHVAGANDFLVHVVVPDVEALRTLALDAFTSRDEVAQVETSLVFSHDHEPRLPNFVTPTD